MGQQMELRHLEMQCRRVRKAKPLRHLCHLRQEIATPLTRNIVVNGDGLEHVRATLERKIKSMFAYRSPFWRSPIPFGKKHSCLAQVTEPIPIALSPLDFLLLVFHNAAKPTQWFILHLTSVVALHSVDKHKPPPRPLASTNISCRSLR